jgi:DNA repair exonuclease SbcCD ATPase subunit
MKRVKLKEVTLFGFKSFKQDTTISLPLAPGFIYLTGNNQVEPLGANGAGKSAFWDAVTWCLTNASVKGKKASDLTSWGETKMGVELKLEVNGVEWVVTRLANPSRLFIGDNQVEQTAVDELIGLSRARFLNSVLFGQNVKLFYDLDNTGRGALLDEILNLEVWLKLSKDAGSKAKVCAAQVTSLEKEVAYTQGRIDALPSLAEQQRLSDAYEAESAAVFEGQLVKLAKAEEQLLGVQTEVLLLESQINDWPTLQNDLAEIDNEIATRRERLAVADAAYKRCMHSIFFYRDNKVCPECTQRISQEFATRTTDRLDLEAGILSGEIDTIKAEGNELLAMRKAAADEQQAHDAVLQELKRRLATAQANVAACKHAVEIETETAELMATRNVNPYTVTIKGTEEQQHLLGITLHNLENQINDQNVARQEYEYWELNFKKLRLWQIERILKVLEIEVSAEASVLGLAGWTIKFTTEVETKSGTMRPGVHIQVQSTHSGKVWSEQSGGEEQRVRLAVSMGFGNMIQRMSGVFYEFESWDEPSAWLSAEGIEDLMECLRNRASTLGKRLWLVDHRALSATGFDEVWRITKDAQGSRMECLSGAQ